MTPRYNPEVNGFWMCDIGRFQYEWVESTDRLRKPLVRRQDGIQAVVTWKEALYAVRDLLNAAGRRDATSVRLLASAHASLEELFLLRRLAQELKGEGALEHVHVTWRESDKGQPVDTKFPVPLTDAPNVAGARALSLAVGADGRTPELAELRSAMDQRTVSVLYVFDPGPAGSLGDADWIVEARRSGLLNALVYQGVLNTELARVADVVLPGAAWVEKDACYVNNQGRVQGASKVLNPPGEAVEDWQILTSVAVALGLTLSYTSSQQVRQDVPSALVPLPAEPGVEGTDDAVAGHERLGEMTFNRPVPARHWLHASNPMERWKWNMMFQDLPPVKGHSVQMEGVASPAVIPLKLVSEDLDHTSR